MINIFNFNVEVENKVMFFEISDQNGPTCIQPEHHPWAPETRRLPYHITM
jgi:hypothetical protein